MGVSSGAFTKRVLVDYFGVPDDRVDIITNEREYGNGVNSEMVKRVLDINSINSVGLVITVDHGSNDDDRFKIIKNNNIDIIVTDHHILPETGVPKNVNEFVNPQQDGCELSKFISGATVIYLVMLQVYKLFKFHGREVSRDDNLDRLLPIVTNTILTDQMSLRAPINRHLLIRGMVELNRVNDIPWITIKSMIDLPDHVNENTIGFLIGPILNAAGRMGNAHLATEFLACSDLERSKFLLNDLVENNTARKKLQNRLMVMAVEQVKQYTKKFNNTLVTLLPEESEGVNGIIAGNIGERYNKPIFSLAKNKEGNLVGSGRGILNGFDLTKIFKRIREVNSDILIKAGGHKMAAGLSIKPDKLVEFLTLFEKFTKEQKVILKTEEVRYYDLDIPSTLITKQLLDEINKAGPFGNSWNFPLLKSKVRVSKSFKIGADKSHMILKIDPSNGYEHLHAFYPSFDSRVLKFMDDEYCNIIYTISYEKKKIKILVKDITSA